MKKYLILSSILTIFCIKAQELDNDFLDSLPDDVREDIEERAADNIKSSEGNYRPSQYSTKLERAEALIDLKVRIEKDLLELENRLSSDEKLELTYELKLFGSDFFSTFQSSFMPINEPNLDSSYTLDVGDILTIQLIGQEDYIEDFKIIGDGSINIPNIGKLTLVGLTLESASQLIKTRVNTSFISTKAFINLSEVRDINVLVAGNAKNPGIYTLSGNSNLLQAISIAGGINEFGSYRAINLVRNNKIIEELDIYDLLINGNYNLKERLRSGDVVFVEPRKKIISIDGAVQRPAKYELKDKENLNVVINYANGFKQTADFENITLERILDGALKSIPVINSSQFESIKPIDGDLIYIREHPYRTAVIAGAVLKPGTYVMSPGENLDDLINKAGGFTDNAYPFGSIYESKEAKIINEKAKDLLYQEFLDNIIALSQRSVGSNLDIAPIVKLTEEINKSDANGRIVVDMLNDEARKTLKIQEGDTLLVPEKNNNIFVYGEVSSEGSVRYIPNQDINYFINKSGGLKKYADTEAIYILHPNGETDRYKIKRNIFENQPSSGLKTYPGSIIFVPKKLDNTTTRTLAAQAYVTILGNLGLALASLNSISDN